MAPGGGGGGGCATKRVRASTRKPRRSQCKKRVLKPKNIPETPQEHQDMEAAATASGCSSPKAERFRIPEAETCPPAPKKARPAGPTCSSSLHRSPIAFFASKDIELFFLASSSS